MKPLLSPELYWLVLTTVMTGLFWIPYLLQRIALRGFGTALWDPQGNTHTDSGWAKRMMRAHQNAVENLVVFAPLALAVHATGSGTAATAAACMIYFGARATHFVVYSLAVPVLRVVAFAAGVGAQGVLALTLLDVL